jgi:riboflavin-specific deaminase-like protein
MGRPQVIINMAATVDGKTASAAREYPRFTSPFDRARMERLRALADAVLVGAETVRAIDPPLQLRDPESIAARLKAGKPAGLVQVVLSASGRLPPQAKALAAASARARIVATTETGERALAGLGRDVEVWVLGKNRVDLETLLRRLQNQGVERLLVEGGAETNGSFLDADVVDELYLTIAPTLLGGRNAPPLVGGDGLTLANRRRLELVELTREGHELYCHYRVERDAVPPDPSHGGHLP